MSSQLGPNGHMFSRLVAILNSTGGILIFGIVIIINLDIVSRFLFNSPIDGVTELVELSIVAIVFLQLADTVRQGRLTRSDGLYSVICKKNPRIGHALGTFFDIARLADAWAQKYYVGNIGIVVIPVWPVRLVIVVGAIAVVFVFIGLAKRHIAALSAGENFER
jgi:TRAP-type C4-dicarboxylate transport system permease small subunit